MLLDPLPCHTFLDPLPSSVTYFMDGPMQRFVASNEDDPETS